MKKMNWTVYQLYLALLVKGGKIEKSYKHQDAVEVIVRMPGMPNSYLLHFHLEPVETALSYHAYLPHITRKGTK